MHAFTAIFFNHREHRLRALWRIGLFIIIWLSLTIALLVAAKLAVHGTVDDSAGDHAFEAICGFLSAIASLWLAGRLFDRRRLVDFGLRLDRHSWLDFLIGLVLGGLAITAAMLVSLVLGWAKITDTLVAPETMLGRGFVLNFIAFALLVLLAAALEELLCRGYLLTNLAEGFHFARTGPGWAIVAAVLLSSGLFGMTHVTNPNANVMGTVSALLGGLITAVGYVMTGRLALPIGLHATWNFFQCAVFGSTVSGMDFGSPSLFVIERTGPELWIGGAYGLESGLLFNLAALLTIPLIVLWVRIRRGEVRIEVEIARPPGASAATSIVPQS